MKNFYIFFSKYSILLEFLRKSISTILTFWYNISCLPPLQPTPNNHGVFKNIIFFGPTDTKIEKHFKWYDIATEIIKLWLSWVLWGKKYSVKFDLCSYFAVVVGWEEKFENKAKRSPARLGAGAELGNKFNYI